MKPCKLFVLLMMTIAPLAFCASPSTQSASDGPKHQHWAATDDAPDGIHALVNSIPVKKGDAIRAMKNAVAEARRERDRVAKSPVRQIMVSGGDRFFGPTYKTDESDRAAKRASMDAITQKIIDLQKQIKTIENDDLWLPSEANNVAFTVGSVGILPTLHITQIVDDGDLIGEAGDQGFWLKGIDTKSLVDDKDYTFGQTVQVTGTKRYTTAMGSSRTVYLVEPIDLKRYLVVSSD